jgi:hypothetical protein
MGRWALLPCLVGHTSSYGWRQKAKDTSERHDEHIMDMFIEGEYEAIMPCWGRAPTFSVVTALTRQSL